MPWFAFQAPIQTNISINGPPQGFTTKPVASATNNFRRRSFRRNSWPNHLGEKDTTPTKFCSIFQGSKICSWNLAKFDRKMKKTQKRKMLFGFAKNICLRLRSYKTLWPCSHLLLSRGLHRARSRSFQRTWWRGVVDPTTWSLDLSCTSYVICPIYYCMYQVIRDLLYIVIWYHGSHEQHWKNWSVGSINFKDSKCSAVHDRLQRTRGQKHKASDGIVQGANGHPLINNIPKKTTWKYIGVFMIFHGVLHFSWHFHVVFFPMLFVSPHVGHEKTTITPQRLSQKLFATQRAFGGMDMCPSVDLSWSWLKDDGM